MTETAYKVRWKHPTRGWVDSHSYHDTSENTDEAKARECLAQDIAYFYDNIEIQLCEVVTTVIERHYGRNKRERSTS